MKFIKIESRKVDFIQLTSQIELRKIDILFIRYLLSSNQLKLIFTDFKMQTLSAVIDAAKRKGNVKTEIANSWSKTLKTLSI